MHLINLSINRIIIHQIFQRKADGSVVLPVQSHEFTKFSSSAMETFKSRVTDALGEGSRAVQMEIVSKGPSHLPSLIDNMVGQDDKNFSVSSFDIATKLTTAQQMKSIPGGIVVIFSGTYGAASKKFLGIIKAEIHSGYEKEVSKTTKEISLKFVEEVLLTPSNKLYKTAGFFERSKYDKKTNDLNKKWLVMVSDYQISVTDGKAAAKYFYQSFLGCGYPQTSAKTTKEFYEATSEFIADMDVSDEKKTDLFNALSTYLKVDTSSTISPDDFGGKYFDLNTQDAYTSYIEDCGLPTTAFTKDLAHIESKLKLRKISFSSNVKITAPLDKFKNLIVIEEIEGDLTEAGEPAQWTKVIVKDRIVHQE